MDLTDLSENMLAGVTGAFPATYFQLGKDGALPADDYPLAQIIEHLDAHVCDLCRHVHGMILRKDTKEYARWQFPSHLNCRRILVDIHRDEVDNDGRPTAPNFAEPPAELVARHGHFVNDPKKYEALRVPARPTGRDFIVRRRAGRPTELVFARALPDTLLRGTMRQIAMTIFTDVVNNGPGPYAAQHARILQQCARQSAARQWWDHLDTEAAHWAHQWGGYLPREQFRQLPSHALEAEPDVALLYYDSYKRGEIPTVIFRADNLRVGAVDIDRLHVMWSADVGAFFHVHRLDQARLIDEAGDFAPLTGDWP
jgi:hypothetical protein